MGRENRIARMSAAAAIAVRVRRESATAGVTQLSRLPLQRRSHARNGEGRRICRKERRICRTIPSTGARYQAPRVIVDFHPVWTPDGNALVYVPTGSSGQLAIVRVTKDQAVTFGVPTLAPAVVTGRVTASFPRPYDVLPDGRFVGPVVPGYDSLMPFAGGNQIRVVMNWLEELKRLVPTN